MEIDQQTGSARGGQPPESPGCGHPDALRREPGPAPGEEGHYEPCQEAMATLYTFLDGELTAERRDQIQRHLDDCAPCFEAFGFEAELKSVIALKCQEEVPASLRNRVAEALRAEGAWT